MSEDLKKLTLSQCFKQLFVFIRPHRKTLMLGLLLVIILHVTYVVMPMTEGRITSQLQLDLTDMAKGIPGAHIQMNKVYAIIAQLFLVYVMKISCQFSSVFLLTDAIQKTVYDIRNAIEAKINRLPVSYFDKHPAGELLSRITNDAETVSNALQQTLSRVIGAICTFSFCLIAMLMIQPTMTLIVLAGMPVIGFISVFIMKKAQPVFDRQQAALAGLNTCVNELYGGFGEILASNYQAKATERFEKANEEMRKEGFKAQLLSGSIGPGTSLVTYLVIGCCALYGCFLVLRGQLLLGQLQAFIRYIWNVNDPISQLSQLSAAVQSAFSGMNRLFTFLQLPEEEQTKTLKPVKKVESVDFDHVDFSYTDKPLMEDINFKVDQGQTIAIVGPTGAGKTTLTNLLLRYYTPQKGQITINGQNIQDFSFEDLRDFYGLVLQDAWLFEGTVMDNLLYARKDATREDAIAAAKACGLHEMIESLENGYDTQITEGAENLSQGQKQLITIVRAMIKDPQILILDEATSSVDTRLERRLQSAMDLMMKGRTSFVIAHRLSTIVNAHRILVVENGSIIEEGNHEQLLAQNGAYAALYNSQFRDMDEVPA